MKRHEKPKKPFYKRVWFIAICAVFALGIIGSLLGGEGNITDDSSVPPLASSSGQPLPVEQPEAVSASIGEKNALQSAKSYLTLMAFSRSGLVSQLVFEGYTTEEATYGADNCGADWMEQTAKSAKAYLDISSFSRSGLVDQLIFEGFTREEAEYGASKNGY